MIEAGSMKPGDLVNGKYRIDYVLGQGGFGVVLGATDLSLQREVAIKVLHPTLAQDEVFKARFLREARATVQLRSEHSVRVHEVDFAETIPYIVMERLVGRDLGVVLQDQGRLPVEHALDYILQATEGIAEAHAAGIVHRDIKPANLFLTERPDKRPLIKVLDYGLAKAPTAGGTRLTKDSRIFGSPDYMSPEQLRGEADVDARADIWALGVSLYELLAGVVPFAAGSAAEVGVGILRDSPVPLHERCPGIPVDLSTVILRCLEKEPSHRYANVAELAAALEPYSRQLPSSVRERVGRVLNTNTPTSLARLPVQHLPRPNADDIGFTETDLAVDTKARPTTRRVSWTAARGVAGLLVVVLASGALGLFALSRKPPANETFTAATSPESAAPATSSLASSVPSSLPSFAAGPASTPSAASTTPPERTPSAASRSTRPLPAPKKPAPGAPAIDARPARTDPAKDPVHL